MKRRGTLGAAGLLATAFWIAPAWPSTPPLHELQLESEETLNERLIDSSGRERGRLLVARAARWMERDPAQTLDSLDEAKPLLDPTKDLESLVHLETTRCWALYQLARLEDSAAACAEALSIGEPADPPLRSLSRTYNAAGVIALSDGRLADAIEGFNVAYRSGITSGELRQAAAAKNNLGLAFWRRGLHMTALESFQSGLDISAQIDDRAVEHVLDFNVGLTQTDLGRYDVAREHYRRALDWALETDNPRKELTALIYLAKADIGDGSGTRGIEALERAVTDERFAFDPVHLAEAYGTLGVALQKTGRVEQSLEVFDRGFALAETTGNEVLRRDLVLGAAGSLTAAGSLDEAESMLAALIPELRSEDLGELLVLALRQRSRTAEARGDLTAALRDLREADQLASKANAQEFGEKLSLLTVQHDLQAKERESQLAREREAAERYREARTRTIRNAMIGTFLLLIVVALLWHSRRVQARSAAAERAGKIQLEELVQERTRALENEMTERARADDRRLRLEQQLAEADKLRALGQLTGGIAHDFNNLLTVTTFASDLLDGRLARRDRESHQLLEDIRTATRSGAEITGRLLSYARKQPLLPEPVELGTLLDEILPLIQRTVGAGVTVEVDGDSRERVTMVDRSQLTTAVLNLAFNAREAMEERGTLTLRVAGRNVRSGEKTSYPGSVGPGRYVSLTVTDTGRGMQPGELSRACEPFYSTKPAADGAGLGLSMVYGFARQSGGDIKIRSLPGVGTSVTLLFPVRQDPSETSASDHPAASWTPPYVGHVLLVEDDTDLAEVTSRVLESLGLEVTLATGGVEAQRLLSVGPPPDMMIVDVVMAGPANGYDVAEYARLKHPEVPIVMTSGYVENHDTRYPFLRKPYSVEELKSCLAELLGMEDLEEQPAETLHGADTPGRPRPHAADDPAAAP